jgi:hypothetical protein
MVKALSLNAGLPMPHLTPDLLANAASALTLLTFIARSRTAWALTDASAAAAVRHDLTLALSIISLLPFDKAAIAALSCAPTATRGVSSSRGNEDDSAEAAEPLLQLQTGWFWVTAVSKAGPTAGALSILSLSREALSYTFCDFFLFCRTVHVPKSRPVERTRLHC